MLEAEAKPAVDESAARPAMSDRQDCVAVRGLVYPPALELLASGRVRLSN